MFFVYILKSLKDGKFYIGMTNDVKARLKRHEKGQVPSTKNRRPLQLLYTEEYSNRQLARKREKFLKSGPGHQALSILLLKGRVPTSSR